MDMEGIRQAAVAYYEHLPEEKKKSAEDTFKAMDKNGDGKISLREYLGYLASSNNAVFTHPNIFSALDKDNNGNLDFEETKVLYYILFSGRALLCKCCGTFLADVYFSCFQCFCLDESASTYDLCCDCFGGKKFRHLDGHIFWDNYTLLSKSRSLALKAPEQRREVLEKIKTIVEVTGLVVGVAAIASSCGCSIM
ncbi:uncharacterized protein LOC18110626 isoform X2 [Populus trichocarpa]|uniref:uncharacterized protein LOC18110626 isoform X2 n=1 Tax=Populus trichocarpa TaxID=3694 RepID=UPI000D18A0FA|nr:uncharacterized protein LOC18110626 isoform X2 [Populus trichocarpa]|eukprot:XP_024447079.1 uncharacterized protein LOC18110626 isoform X2 [Populus trichocarpa]